MNNPMEVARIEERIANLERDLAVARLAREDAMRASKTQIFRIASNSRYGIQHTLVVHNGKARCSCEAATFYPNRRCPHFRQLWQAGELDTNVVFTGGLVVE